MVKVLFELEIFYVCTLLAKDIRIIHIKLLCQNCKHEKDVCGYMLEWVSGKERERECVCVCVCVCGGGGGAWEREKRNHLLVPLWTVC
jgi:hypothetical protein